MAAPSTTARVAPSGGIPFGDPFSTVIAFSQDSDIMIWTKSLTPPAINGGDPVDTTTMENTTVRTRRSRTLYDVDEFTFTGSYDERAYSQVIAIVNSEGSITIHFPDDATLDFYGYLRIFAPNENAEGGDQPTATVTVTVTNWDPSNNVEAVPVLTEAAGT